jgi:ATP-binding cassette, subfamily B, multidrug efflux pump
MKDFKEYTRERPDSVIFKRLLSYLKPHKKRFFWVLILMFVSIVVQLIPSILIGVTIDTVINPEITYDTKVMYLIVLSVGFLGILSVSMVATYYQTLWLQDIGQTIIYKMRKEVFDHIYALGVAQINQVPIGKLVTRVTNDTNTLSEMYTNVAANLIRNIVFNSRISFHLLFICSKLL